MVRVRVLVRTSTSRLLNTARIGIFCEERDIFQIFVISPIRKNQYAMRGDYSWLYQGIQQDRVRVVMLRSFCIVGSQPVLKIV